MLQLIYMSQASHSMAETDMQALCKQAASNNVSDEITGVLLMENEHFLQALEGPREAVEDTFLRIIGDPRHHSLRLLSRRMVTKRLFGEWSMALNSTDTDKQLTIETIRCVIDGAPQNLGERFYEVFLQRRAA